MEDKTRLTNGQMQSLVTYFNWMRIKYDKNGVLVYSPHPTEDAGWFPVLQYQIKAWLEHEKATKELNVDPIEGQWHDVTW
jgi:hypothetical protein